jgi:hypothetical protein
MADSGNPTPRVGSEHKYAAIARFKHSQHLDYDKEIGTLISENRHAFEDVVDRINAHLTKLGVPDSPELTLAICHLEQAKDALIHHVGKVDGVPFEQAVRASMKQA